MEQVVREELTRIFETFRVISSTAFACGDTVVDVKPDKLIGSFQQHLYNQCYIRHVSDARSIQGLSTNGAGDMAATLALNHPGGVFTDLGWTVSKVLRDGKVFARKQDFARTFDPGHYWDPETPWGPLREGQPIAVTYPRDFVSGDRGHYHAFGETVHCDAFPENLVRLYWNVNAEGIVSLMPALIRKLNRFQVPFEVKAPCKRDSYYRRDACVLYVARRHYHITAEIVSDVYAGIREHLASGIPLFTKRLNHGLALAENPPGNFSFGSHRCLILAESLWAAFEKELNSVEEWLEELQSVFGQYRLSLDQPYLNPGSKDDYEFPYSGD